MVHIGFEVDHLQLGAVVHDVEDGNEWTLADVVAEAWGQVPRGPFVAGSKEAVAKLS